jgi:hypothetical protein
MKKIIAIGLTISEKILWRNLNLPLLVILLVKKLVFITLVSVIHDKILIRYRKHQVEWRNIVLPLFIKIFVEKNITSLIWHLLVAKNIFAMGHTISEKIMWPNLNLTLLAILFVKKLIFITLISVISAKYYFVIGSIFSGPTAQQQQASRPTLLCASLDLASR